MGHQTSSADAPSFTAGRKPVRRADVIGGKVYALASRAYDRDYVAPRPPSNGRALDQVIGFARRLDAGLEDRDFSDAGRRLDRMDDGAFIRFGLSPQDIAELRDRFAPWPGSDRQGVCTPLILSQGIMFVATPGGDGS